MSCATSLFRPTRIIRAGVFRQGRSVHEPSSERERRMTSRRHFLSSAAVGVLAAGPASGCPAARAADDAARPERTDKPMVISTWKHGLPANAAAWEKLRGGGRAWMPSRPARVAESDPTCRSVGFGGRPDRDGHVTLDACIMDERGNCGSVAFLEHIKNPVSVARLVMEKTPHVMLVGEGALQFALAHGFQKEPC